MAEWVSTWARAALLALAIGLPATAAPAPLHHDRGRLLDPDGHEVVLFGTNYPAPFGYPFLNLTANPELDPRLVIDADLRAMKLLGLNCVRVLMHDAELQSADGALVDNLHLELLDYLLAAASREGLYLILTPLSLARGVDPVRDEAGQEVSLRARFGGVPSLVTEATARERVARYLTALVERRNPLTGVTYAAEPAIAVIDLFGQPLTGADAEALKAAVDGWIDALRAAGARQPVTLWTGHGASAAADLALRTKADGVSVSAYPAGVGSGLVDEADHLAGAESDFGLARPALRGRLRIAVEFDAADTLNGHLLPALAMALRAGGAAAACHFHWDTATGAWLNNEWPAHWLHPSATPSRAAALAVAAAVFAETQAGSPVPRVPESFRGGPIRIETRPDTTRWMDPGQLLHGNSIGEQPPAPEALRRVLGVGSSTVVETDALGLYVLDRLAPGLWRLLLLPDPLVVGNPFDPARWQPPAAVAAVARPTGTRRSLRLRLPDLGDEFRAWLTQPTEGGAEAVAYVQAEAQRLVLRPGVYLLARGAERPAVPDRFDAALPMLLPPAGPPLLEAFIPPVADPSRALLLGCDVLGGPDLRVELEVTSVEGRQRLPAAPPEPAARATRDVTTARTLAVRRHAAVPVELLRGTPRLRWIARDAEGETFFPAEPTELEIGADLPFVIARFGADGRLPSYTGAPRDWFTCYRVGAVEPARNALRIDADQFGVDGRWLLRVPVPAGGERGGYDALRLRARAQPRGTRLWLGCYERDGAIFGVTVEMADSYRAITVPLERIGYLSGGRRRPRLDLTALREVRLACGAVDQTEPFAGRRTVDLDDLAFVRLAAPAPRQ